MATPTYTLQDAYDTFYGILKEDEDTSQYPIVLAKQFINKAQHSICDGVVRHPTTKEQIRKPFLNFLNKEGFFVSVQYTNVVSAPTI
jgi:hypothetical protein